MLKRFMHYNPKDKTTNEIIYSSAGLKLRNLIDNTIVEEGLIIRPSTERNEYEEYIDEDQAKLPVVCFMDLKGSQSALMKFRLLEASENKFMVKIIPYYDIKQILPCNINLLCYMFPEVPNNLLYNGNTMFFDPTKELEENIQLILDNLGESYTLDYNGNATNLPIKNDQRQSYKNKTEELSSRNIQETDLQDNLPLVGLIDLSGNQASITRYEILKYSNNKFNIIVLPYHSLQYKDTEDDSENITPIKLNLLGYMFAELPNNIKYDGNKIFINPSLDPQTNAQLILDNLGDTYELTCENSATNLTN